MAAMPAASRRRIHLTETPRLSVILQQHGLPGEPKAATITRLVERADAMESSNEDFLVFHPPGPPVTTDDVANLLAQEDLELHQEQAGG